MLRKSVPNSESVNGQIKNRKVEEEIQILKVIISPAKKMKIRNDILPYKNIPFFIKEAEKLFLHGKYVI